MEKVILNDQKEWIPRQNAIIFGDEDVDGITSAAIVGHRYNLENVEFVFVNARTLGNKLHERISEFQNLEKNQDIDLFIVDVGINKANVEIIEKSLTILVKNNVRVYYFDSHSNKYKGKPLLLHLRRTNANIFHGKIGSAAASIVHDFLGAEETKRLRVLGALSDRELSLTKKYKHEKNGLRALQAAVAWGAWKDEAFLDMITRRLIENPNLDCENDVDISKYALVANNHRDNLLKHVLRRGKVLEISQTPRILAVMVLDREDFGKARGTIAGRLAGEWGGAIILITKAVSDEDAYAVTVRNSYSHKLDLEVLGQLSRTKNSGGSKGAYRLTIKKDSLFIFLSKVQSWSRNLTAPWFVQNSNRQKFKRKRRNFKSNKQHRNKNSLNKESESLDSENDEIEIESEIIDLTDLE